MSNIIDEGIVRLKFDADRFNSAIKGSMQSIANLKNSLKNGFNNISQHFSLASINNSIQEVSNKFSALGVMGMTVLQNLTNSAVEAGKRITSALTIDPIKMGFQEYETQINAVQTILANTESKGSTIEDVNKALDELNHYADMTIYNFTEMTRNIGTFTAAGIDLDTSVSAIKGIANLAAVSGSNSQQASTAMYQLSQALAAGSLKLQDWNSVVNAGMGGQVFQDALKETARVHGIAIDEMIEQEGSFRETLSKGWISSEILTETLAKFTGDLTEAELKSMGYNDEQIKSIIKMGNTANDAATKVKTFTQLFDTLGEALQSGWTQSWETIIGDFNEAKTFLTEISDTLSAIINQSSDSRNAILGTWKELGGRNSLLDAVRNSMNAVLNVGSAVKKMMSAIIPPMTGQKLVEITNRIKALSEKLKTKSEDIKKFAESLKPISEIKTKAIDKLSDFGKNSKLFSGISEAFKSIAGNVSILDEFQKLTSSIFTVIKQGMANTASFFKRLNELGTIKTLLGGINNAIAAVIKTVRMLVEAFSEVFSSGLDPDFIHSVIEKFRKLTESFVLSEKSSGRLKNVFKQIFTTAKTVLNVLAPLFKALFNAAVAIIPTLVSAITSVISSSAGFIPQLISLAASVIPALISAFIRAIPIIASFAQQGFKLAGMILPTLLKAFWGALDSVTKFWNGFQKLGGMTALGNTVYSVFLTVVKAINIAKNAFNTVFPVIDSGAKLIFAVVSSFKKLTDSLLASDTAATSFEMVLTGIFTYIKTGITVVQTISGSLSALAKNVLPVLQNLFTSIFSNITSESIAQIADNIGHLVAIFEATSGVRTEIFTNILGLFTNGVKGVASFVRQFAKLGGFVSVVQTLRNVFDGIVKILGLAGDAFKDVFKTDFNATVIYGIVEKVRQLTSAFFNSETAAESVKNIFKGVFSVFGLLGSVISSVGKTIAGLSPSFEGVGSAFLNVLGTIGEFIFKLNEAVQTSGVLRTLPTIIITAVNSVSTFLSGWIDTVSPVFEKLKTTVFTVFDAIAARIKARTENASENAKMFDSVIAGMGNSIKFVGNVFSKFIDVLKSVFSNLKPILTKIGEFAGVAFDGITQAVNDSVQDISFDNILDMFNGGLLAALLLAVKNFIGGLSDAVDNGGGILQNIKDVLGGAKDCLESFQQSLQAETLKKIAVAVGILAGSLLVLSLIDSQKLATALGTVTALLGELMGSMAVFSKVAGMEGFGSLAKLASMLIGVSVSVLILSAAVSALSALSWDGLLKGLVGVSALLTGLSLFLSNTDIDSMGLRKGLGLMLLAQGLSIMSSAVIKMAALDLAGLAKGLLGVGVLLAETALFVNNTGDATKVISTSIGMIALGAAMNIFASAMAKFGAMSLAEIGKGLLSMAGSLTLVGVALNLLPPNAVSMGVGLLIVALAIGSLAKSLNSFGQMSLPEIGTGLLAMAGSLAAIVLAMNLANGAVGGAFAVMVMAAAINMLVPALLILGTMSLSEIGTSLLMIAGVFGIMALAGALLTPLVPTILALAAGLLMFGGAVALAGVGVSLLSVGLAGLTVAVASSIDTIVQTCVLLIQSISTILTEAAPAIVESVVVILESIIAACIEIGPQLFELCSVLLQGLIDLVTEFGPKLINLAGELIMSLLSRLAEDLPKIADMGLKMLTELLKAIADNVEDVIAAAVDIIENFIKGISDNVGRVIDAGLDLIISFINGLADGIDKNTEPLLDACDNLIDSVIDGLKKGLLHGINTVVDAAKSIGDAAVNGIKDLLGIHSPSKVFSEIGSYSVEGFATALTDSSMTDMVSKATGEFADTATSSMADSMSGFGDAALGSLNGLDLTDVGNSIGSGLSNSISDSIDLSSVSSSISQVGQTASSDLSLAPTITPVVDMSNATKGVSTIGNAVSDAMKQIPNETTINTKKTVSETSKISASMSSEVTTMIKTIKNRVVEINNNLTKLNDNITGLQVVMDTGTLVGELSTSIDTNLGTVNAMQRRGV